MGWRTVRDQLGQAYGVQALRRRPGSSGVLPGMLGLGMAPTAAVFSVVHAVLFPPSPFPKPTRCGG